MVNTVAVRCDATLSPHRCVLNRSVRSISSRRRLVSGVAAGDSVVVRHGGIATVTDIFTGRFSSSGTVQSDEQQVDTSTPFAP
jgi:hypothetical protein